jgi:hypothetical protein
MRQVAVGSTDQTIDIFVQDSSKTTGEGLTGLAYNSSGLTCYYRKGATGTVTQLTLATQTVTGTHTDGGFVELSATNMKGGYRLDLSDTMIASEGDLTIFLQGATNMAPVTIAVDVTAAAVDANVTKWNGTAVATPTVAGVPEVDVTHVSGDSSAANNLESDYDGTGYNKSNSAVGAATSVTNIVSANITQIGGSATPAGNLSDDYDGTGYNKAASRIGTVGAVTGSVTGNVDGNVTGSVGSVTSTVNAAVTSMGTDVITAASINTGAFTADAFAANALVAATFAANSLNGKGDWNTTQQTGDTYAYLTTNLGAAGVNATEAGGTGDHLTAIDLPDQTMNITGNLSGSVGSVTGAVGSVTGNVGGNVVGSVNSVATTVTADLDTIKTQTVTCAQAVTIYAAQGLSATGQAAWEDQYDGTGLTGDTYPARQDQLGNLSSGSSGWSINASTAVITTGSETNDYTDTFSSGVIHIVEDAAGNTDFYYEFDLSTYNGVATQFLWNGYVQSNGDSALARYYDWGTTSWLTIDTLSGANGTTVVELPFDVPVGATGTGANFGLVRFKFESTTSTAIGTDRVRCVFNQSVSGITNGSTITLGSSALNQNYIGNNWNLAQGGQVVTGAFIKGAVVTGTGTGTGGTTYEDCFFGAATIPPSTGVRCGISLGSATLSLGSAGDYRFIGDPTSAVPGAPAATIDCTAGGANITLELRGYSGGITLIGLKSGDVVTVGGSDMGTITLNGADAQVEIRGIWKAVVNNLTGSPSVTKSGVEGTDVATTKANVASILAWTTSALWTGITSMAQWLGALAGKQTPDATALTEIRATGAGSGTYDATTDSLEANADATDLVPTAGENADAVWDEELTGASHNIANSSGRRLRALQEFQGHDGGYVWIDTIGGVAGTTPNENGTVNNPVDSLTDALVIAAAINSKKLFFLPGSSETLSTDLVSYILDGQGWSLACGGYDLSNSYVKGAFVTGISTSDTQNANFRDCLMSAATVGSGVLIDCAIRTSLTITEAGNVTLTNCYDAAGGGVPYIDFAVSGITVQVDRWPGALEVRGMDALDAINVSGDGKFIVHSGCTGGSAYLAGGFEVTDNAGGAVTVTYDDNTTGIASILSWTASALWTGITSMAQWLGALAGKQTPDSTALTEIRATGAGSGTYDATKDSQEAIRDRGDEAWGSGSNGEGAYTGVLTVDDGAGNGLEGVVVNARRGGVLIASGTTDVNGQITDWVFGAYTYDLAASIGGYQPATDTITVTEDGWAKTISLSIISITAPSDPTLCTVQFRVKKGATAVSGAKCYAELQGINQASDGTVLSNDELSATTDAQGIAELELVQEGEIVKGSGLYKIRIEIDGKPVANTKVKIPNQATALFGDLLP